MNNTTKARILLVDDHPIVRQGLEQLINDETDLAVSVSVETGQAALASLDSNPLDLAVVDLSLKDTSGVELIKEILQRKPTLPILVLSMHDETLHAERVLRLGAKGYVMKQEATERVLDAIRQVLRGGIYLSQRMSAQLLHQMVGGKPPTGPSLLSSLTDREYEVFTMIGRGMGTREIADKLGLSIKTIEAHREHIKDKLNLKNANELLRSALQHTQGLA